MPDTNRAREAASEQTRRQSERAGVPPPLYPLHTGDAETLRRLSIYLRTSSDSRKSVFTRGVRDGLAKIVDQIATRLETQVRERERDRADDLEAKLCVEIDELKEKNDTLSEMLRGMARRATHERRMIGRFSFSTPEHPDLIDRDGDRWEWTPAHGAYRTVSGVYRLAYREDIDHLAGPVREAE